MMKLNEKKVLNKMEQISYRDESLGQEQEIAEKEII